MPGMLKGMDLSFWWKAGLFQSLLIRYGCILPAQQE
jgi:hypothetical protein